MFTSDEGEHLDGELTLGRFSGRTRLLGVAMLVTGGAMLVTRVVTLAVTLAARRHS